MPQGLCLRPVYSPAGPPTPLGRRHSLRERSSQDSQSYIGARSAAVAADSPSQQGVQSFDIRHLPGPLASVEAMHRDAGEAVILQHHVDGGRGVEVGGGFRGVDMGG